MYLFPLFFFFRYTQYDFIVVLIGYFVYPFECICKKCMGYFGNYYAYCVSLV